MGVQLYTERSWLMPGQKYVPLLFPYWGNPETDKNDPDFGRFDAYCKSGHGYFQLSGSGASADFFLLPYEFSFDHESMRLSYDIAKQAAALGKKLIVFFNSDLQEEIPVPNAIVFRTSFRRSSRRKNEFAMPGWSADFGYTPMKVKPAKPSVGYCGYIDYLFPGDGMFWASLYNNLSGRTSPMHRIGPRLRGKLVRQLRKDPNIQTNFIIRSGFWGGNMDRMQARKEYIQNMSGSSYALVTRGGGNFSYRLYEVLSSGRIPLFLDTDCALPFDHILDWKEYLVWIPEQEAANAAEILADFHRSISGELFLEKALSCRRLYEEYICPAGFFRNLPKCLSR